MGTLDGKTSLVTGALGALGTPISEALAREGATVVLHVRDAARGNVAVEALKAKTGNPNIDYLVADFQSLAAVRMLADEFKTRFKKLHILINNAAIFSATRKTTAEGNEAMFGINHLAPFLLTNLLLDTLKDSAPSRIVVLTMDNTGPIKLDDLNSERSFDKIKTLFHSKASQGAFVRELAKKLVNTNVSVNAVNPDVTKTTLIREAPFWLKAIFALTGQTPEVGAAGPLLLATSPALEQVTGAFYTKIKAKPFPKAVSDDTANAQLWAASAKLVGLK